MSSYRDISDDAADLQTLFSFRYSISHDHIIHPRSIELRNRFHNPADHLHGEVIGTGEAKSPSFAFSYSGAVTGNNKCFLHSHLIFFV